MWPCFQAFCFFPPLGVLPGENTSVCLFKEVKAGIMCNPMTPGAGALSLMLALLFGWIFSLSTISSMHLWKATRQAALARGRTEQIAISAAHSRMAGDRPLLHSPSQRQHIYSYLQHFLQPHLCARTSHSGASSGTGRGYIKAFSRTRSPLFSSHSTSVGTSSRT